MLRGIYGDHDRYCATYWSSYGGVYFAGDGARSTRTATSGCSGAWTT